LLWLSGTFFPTKRHFFAKHYLMPRYKLRTLLIVLALGPPFAALVISVAVSTPWQIYLNRSVAERMDELNTAKSLNNGSRLTMAAERHATLRYKRTDAEARKQSALYRAIVPVP
jgi:hypothetical protein